MFGIGGSIIIIPALYMIFDKIGIPKSELMHFSIGTAFSIMIFTSITNTVSHIKLGNTMPGIIAKMIPSLIAGVIIGTWSIKYIGSESLKKIFASFLILIAIDLFIKLSKRIRKSETPCPKTLPFAGIIIGSISGLMGIGGGSIVIPFLLFLGYETRKVIGTSAVLTLPIALTGAAISALHMIDIHTSVPMSLGFIYFPALLTISAFCVISVPIGAKTLGFIPQERARQIFAILLFITSLRMFFF